MIYRTCVLLIAAGLILAWNPLATAADEERSAEKGDSDASAGSPEVNLLNNGTQPRQQLRYTYEAGAERTFTLNTQSTVDRQVAGFPVPTERNPEIEATINITIEKVDDDGKAHIRMEYARVRLAEPDGANPASRRQLERTLSRVEGAVVRLVTCDRGLVHSIGMEEIDPDNAEARYVIGDMQYHVQQLIVPLPEKQIGAGARWRVESSNELTGIKSLTRSTYELKQFDNGAFEVKLIAEQTADSQDVVFPGSTHEMKLDQMTAEVEGAVTARLGFPIPTAGDTSTSNESEFALELNNAPQQMIQKMRVTHALRDRTDQRDDAADADAGSEKGD